MNTDYSNPYISVYHPSRFELDAAYQHCQSLGVDRNMEQLPKTERGIPSDSSISRHAVYMYTKKLRGFYKDFFKMAGCFGMADFLLDNELRIYNCGGNISLISELDQINFHVGADLSEKKIGYNAVSMCKALFGNTFIKNTVVVLDKGESYAAPLRPYVFLAVQTKSYVQSYGIQYHLMVVREEEFSDNCYLFAKFISDFNECLIAKAYNIPPLEFTNAVNGPDSAMHVFTDGEGYITLVNESFENRMNTTTPQIGGQPVGNIIPAARSAVYSVKAGKNVYMKNIRIQNDTGSYDNYYMDAVGICSGGKLTDILFSFKEVNAEKRKAGRIASSGAFFSFEDIIGGKNAEFQKTKDLAVRIAKGNSNILIAGESGTGKEMFAQSIHQESPRRNQPFVSINCAAIPKELISSELFGYDEGAFTGAKKTGAPGKFEIADGGTLFLDEIGEMPLDMQSVLLRVIEEQRITRLGSVRSKKIDVRIIAASNRNLIECIHNKTFRADLYYRLNVMQLTLPPLRSRKEDIPMLVEHFLHQLKDTPNTSITNISREAMEMLVAYDWPGNIRELRNIIERAANVCSGSEIRPCDIMLQNGGVPAETAKTDFSVGSLNREYEDFELERIRSLIIKYNNNKTLVAKELGISRRTLYNKLKKAQQSAKTEF